MVLGAYFFFVKDMSTLIEIQIKVFLFRIKHMLLILIFISFERAYLIYKIKGHQPEYMILVKIVLSSNINANFYFIPSIYEYNQRYNKHSITSFHPLI